MTSKLHIQRIGTSERKYVAEVLETQFANSKNCGMLGRFEKAFAEKVRSTLDLDESQLRVLEISSGTG